MFVYWNLVLDRDNHHAGRYLPTLCNFSGGWFRWIYLSSVVDVMDSWDKIIEELVNDAHAQEMLTSMAFIAVENAKKARDLYREQQEKRLERDTLLGER